MKDNITPEEKLLKIIENPNVEKAKLPLKGKKSSSAVFAKANFCKGFRIDKDILKNIDLAAGNKMLAGICVIVTAFLIFDLIRINMNLGRRFEKLSKGLAVSKMETKQISLPDINLDAVLREARRRNIFTFIPQKAQASGAATPAVETAGNLKLVGILWSQNPQAMIENSQENKTHLLSAGEQFGQFKVKTILRDKVVIQKGEEQWELR